MNRWRIRLGLLPLLVLSVAATATAGAETEARGLEVEDFRFDGPLGCAGATIEKLGHNHFKVIPRHAPGNPGWANMIQFETPAHAKGKSGPKKRTPNFRLLAALGLA